MEILKRTHLESAADFLRQDLKSYGLKELAYIRAVTVKDRRVFVIHGADGIPVAVQGSLNDARILAENQSLTVLSLH